MESGSLGLKGQLGIHRQWRRYQQMLSWDQEWIMYLNGLEVGDFRDQEVQDWQQYSDSTGYLDVMDKAADLEVHIQP